MKRAWSILLTAALFLTALCACTQEDAAEEDGLRLWFVSQSDDGSVALESTVYAGDAQIPDLMEALLAGPDSGELTSPIPEGTGLRAWSLSGSVAQVNLTGEYNRLTDVERTLADYCIVLTLTQLDDVEGVRISVNNSGGSQILYSEDVVLSGAEEEPVELIAALSFRRVGGNQLGVEMRIFRLTENQSATLAVLQALLAGPQETGLTALLPENVEVYSARVENGICYADFSAALLEQVPESEERQLLAVRSIVESLCSLGHVQAVQILVEGEAPDAYGSVDISGPLS